LQPSQHVLTISDGTIIVPTTPGSSKKLHQHKQSGADLEGEVGGQINGSGGQKSPVGSRGEAAASGLGDGFPQKLEHLKKIHNLNFKAL